MGISIGDTVGDYRVLEELGHGGMGRVFKVEHSITRRIEAMKVLAGSRPGEAEAARSLREIQLQARLDHPNIAAVHNAFWSQEDLVLVMELIEGQSLRRVMEQRRVPLATAMDYAGQALAALSYAHGYGIIHRDISPANMMIAANGVLKVTDFGLAKGPGDARLSQSGAPLGSFWYMPPEQVRGSSSDVRSDIYSLGAVLYELVLGKKPFDGESAFAVMADHVGKRPVAPTAVDPAVPERVSAALLRALEKDPDRRFQTAAEFQQALSSSQTAWQIPDTVCQLWFAPPRMFWFAAVFTCLALAAAGSLAYRRLHPPVHERTDVAKMDSPADLVDAGIETTESVPPPRKRVPQAARKPVKSGPNIFRKALAPIWPLSKRDKSESNARQPIPDSSHR